MVSVEEPAPWMRAPIAVSIEQMSTISGSRAELSMTVVPSASTAAMSRFSVAPTDGKSSQIEVPVSRGAVATGAPGWLGWAALGRGRPAGGRAPRELPQDRAPGQRGRCGNEEPGRGVEGGAEPLEPGDVHVQAARADRVAAGGGGLRAAAGGPGGAGGAGPGGGAA